MYVIDQIPVVLAIVAIIANIRAVYVNHISKLTVVYTLSTLGAIMMITATKDWLTPILGINIWTGMNIVILLALAIFTFLEGRDGKATTNS